MEKMKKPDVFLVGEGGDVARLCKAAAFTLPEKS